MTPSVLNLTYITAVCYPRLKFLIRARCRTRPLPGRPIDGGRNEYRGTPLERSHTIQGPCIVKLWGCLLVGVLIRRRFEPLLNSVVGNLRQSTATSASDWATWVTFAKAASTPVLCRSSTMDEGTRRSTSNEHDHGARRDFEQ